MSAISPARLQFEEDGRFSLIERARIIAEASLVAYLVRPRVTVSPSIQKAVLFTILPYEGQVLSVPAIAERAGISEGCCHDAVKSLEAQGLLAREHGFRCNAKRHAIRYERLLELRSQRPHALNKGRKFGSPWRKAHG